MLTDPLLDGTTRLNQMHRLLLDLRAVVRGMQTTVAALPACPEPPTPAQPWVVRWQQQPGERLLYADQSDPRPRGDTP